MSGCARTTLGVGRLMSKRWIRFTDRIYYEAPLDDGDWEMQHVACPACTMDLGLTLEGEPGQVPDVLCQCGTRFTCPHRWSTWWEEISASPSFAPQPEVRREDP